MPPRAAYPTPAGGGMRRIDSETDVSEAGDGPRRDYRYYRVRKSSLIGMINWTHVIATQYPYFLLLLLLVLVHQIFTAVRLHPDLVLNEMIKVYTDVVHEPILLTTGVKASLLSFIVVWVLARHDNPVYLLAFSTFKAPSGWKMSHSQILDMMRAQKCFSKDSVDFMSRILERSGTGQATAWPPAIVQCLKGKPADRSIERSREEAETVICTVVEDALRKAGVSAQEIDILIINCSLFSPTPSLCSMVMQKFNMRQDVKTYNLSGMGCSASPISIDLANTLLQARGGLGGGRALVVSTEIITPNLYHGNEKGFILQNTLFRCGGAAMVLSNRWIKDAHRASYKHLRTVRVQGNDPNSYGCVYETEDEKGERGVRLSKDIVKVAGKCMEKNMTTLGPYVLAFSEQAKVVASLGARFVLKFVYKNLVKMEKDNLAAKLPVVRPYVPDFKRTIDHFCIHAGGRAVIDGIEKNMKLEPFHTEASRMTLLNYGNTSSSSIWYELEYIQDQQRSNPLKKGHRIMQVAFGSGFKCNSTVWLKL
uniref:3-ketoacyl-CoA synthase n=2 Tax=Corethron hystrix TaxID=216773 RepID=A0A7S1BUQ4_9STRA